MVDKINFTGLRLYNPNTGTVLAKYMRKSDDSLKAVATGLSLLDYASGDEQVMLNAEYVAPGKNIIKRPAGHNLTLIGEDGRVKTTAFISEYDSGIALYQRFVKMFNDIRTNLEPSTPEEVLDRFI